jgi:hypothetical protein
MTRFDRLLDRLLGRGSEKPPCVGQLCCAHANIEAGRTVRVDGEERTECYCADCSAMLGWMDAAGERHTVPRDSQRGDDR